VKETRLEKWRGLWHRHHTRITIAVSGALVLVCYGYALRLPFFYDDLPIITWLRRHGWAEIWTSSEGAYYRPLAFTFHKLEQLFSPGTSQFVLHGISLVIYWASAVLVMQIVKLCGRRPAEAMLASFLFAVFPFMFVAIPWVTALGHPLVTFLTLLATFAALKAEQDDAVGWWVLSLTSIALAPFAHESGPVCAVIVGGMVTLQRGLRARRGIVFIVVGGALNVGAVLLRRHIPGVGEAQFQGLRDWLPNTMFFLHGLLYPIAPIVGWLVHHRGAHDFTLIAVSAACFSILLIWLAYRTPSWRWVARSLWWWACGALPAATSLHYGYLYTSPRLYALGAVGIVMLWAAVIVELGKTIRSGWGRNAVRILLAGLILSQNVAFLFRQRELIQSLGSIYQRALEAAEDKANAPLGFVNLPKGVAYHNRIYAMVHESILFVPSYSNVSEFIEVNRKWREADVVAYTPVLQETDLVYAFKGDGIEWEEMRQYAIDHRTVWLTQKYGGRLRLNNVGRIEENSSPSPNDPLVQFEGGPVIESASVEEIQNGHWAVTIIWLASGPLDGEIFVHVNDAANNLVTQADGPALGGMVPIWLWRSGDRIYDVRHIALAEGPGPYTVQVGVYNSNGRFPALVNGTRCPDDAAPVVSIVP
jgi:hypothetical protein